MIKVENLSKSYGQTQALKGISFEVADGEVIGFLGPNGAGKSTTMKILAGYLLPTGGGASVDGMDVVKDSLEVRRRIGYLPESTPLYTEMRVDEYLRFVARIRGVEKSRLKTALSRVVELCGLQRVVGKTVIELSKGYKQRVGLAQAMIHEPELLVFDEPTSGLDPNQIIEVRELIRRLSEEHTVILSTHYLQEVEAVSTRVIIVNLGQIVADDSQENLVSTVETRGLKARIKGPADKVTAQLSELLPGHPIKVLSKDGETTLFGFGLGSKKKDDSFIGDAIAQLVVKNGWELHELIKEQASLEDVFCKLTESDRLEARHA